MKCGEPQGLSYRPTHHTSQSLKFNLLLTHMDYFCLTMYLSSAVGDLYEVVL